MTHPLRVAENCTTHPCTRLKPHDKPPLCSGPPPPPPPLYFLTSPLIRMEQYVGDRAVSKWFSQDRKKSSHLHREVPFHEQSAPIENRKSKKNNINKHEKTRNSGIIKNGSCIFKVPEIKCKFLKGSRISSYKSHNGLLVCNIGSFKASSMQKSGFHCR